ncbi:MAG: heavy metal sensor histidine kinase [Candidatus Tectomicrobia bacterium]|nr:heavy metal sensor histidine kinase [Candidatus Tectomicrobia bacterium]
MLPARETPATTGRSTWCIATRITVYAVAATCALLVAVIGISHWQFSQGLTRDRLLYLGDELNELRAAVRERGVEAQEEIHAESAAHGLMPYYVRLLDENGLLLAASPDTPDALHSLPFPEPMAATELIGPSIPVRLPDGRSLLLLAAKAETPDTGPQWVLQIGLDVTHDGFLLRNYRRILVVVSLAGLVVFAAAAAWLVRYNLRPLLTITRMAQHITAQRLDERIAPSGWPQELAVLALAFDGMLDRLEESVTRLRQFSADLAHELRTPIQNLMLQTEVTLTRVRTEPEYQEALNHGLEELRRLAYMVDDLLFLARAENPQHSVERQALDAREALQKAWDFFDAAAEEQGVSVVCQGSGTLQAEPQLLHRALANLLSNALRHTPAGGTITMTAQADGSGACTLGVADTGRGIAAQHLPRLFDRFYQVDPDRPRSLEGTGLGLSIVRSIMDLHGGRVEVHSTPSCGTTFTLHFPCGHSAAKTQA